MMEGLAARGVAFAEARARVLVDGLLAAAEAELGPGIGVERVEGGIAIVGRGLRRRMIDDVRLRTLGLLARGIGR